MKKNLTVLLAVLIVCCITLFAACNQYHEHTFATEWTFDETNHYHAATCEHTDQKGSFAAHAFDNGTVTENGVIYTCTVCGYEKTHNHTFATEWTFDETNHYHAATCEHTDEKSGLAAHVFGDGTVTATGTEYVCGVCGYKKTQAFVYTVTQEEFASILGSINNYKVNFTSYGDEILIICSDVYYCAFPDSAEYWGYDGTDYFFLCKNADGKDWSKQIVTKEEYESRINSGNVWPLLINCFSDFTYDETTKSYIADEIITTYNGDDYTFRNLSLSFVDGKLTKAAFTIVNPYDDTEGDVYVYTEIGTASATLPTNIHEHTYSEEWSFNDVLHYHEAACGHYLKKDEANHTLVKGVCTVCGYNIVRLSDDGKTVIGVADENCTEVTIPQGVTTIGQSAFYFCNKMTEIVIPDGVTAIEGTAFQTCSALQKIVLPEGLLTIGERAFERCSKLTEITIPSTVEEISAFSFINCSGLERVFLSEGNKTIKVNAFKNCAALTDVLIPKSLTEIGADVFFSTSLSRIFYNGTEAEWASINIHKYNDKLKAATVYYYSETDPVEGNYWHYDEDGKVAAWPKHTYSEEWSFDETSHWHAATCEHTDKKAGLAAHSFTESGEAEEGTVYTCSCGYAETRVSKYRVSAESFANILKSANQFKITVEGSAKDAVYFKVNNVVRVEYADGSVEYYTKEHITFYKYYTAEGCDGWIKDVITESDYIRNAGRLNLLPYIGDSFSEFTFDITEKCYKSASLIAGGNELKDVVVRFENGRITEASFTTQGISFAYNDFDNVSANVPANIHEHTFSTEWSFNGNTHWHAATCGYTGIIDSADHVFGESECTVCGYSLFEISSDGKKLIALNSPNVTSVTIPSGIVTIGDNVFAYSLLTSIVIPEGVEDIGKNAFCYSELLEQVTFPSTLLYIRDYAFQGCSKLASVEFPQTLNTIGEYAFADCTSLTELYVPASVVTCGSYYCKGCTALTTVNVPRCVVDFVQGYLVDCPNIDTIVISGNLKKLNVRSLVNLTKLTTIVIPRSVTEIGYKVFSGSLKTVYYGGTEADWASIEFDEESMIDSATVYYYSETEPNEAGNFWHYVDGVATKW